MDDELKAYIDAQITLSIVEFHAALVERGQIKPPPPQQGITADYTADRGFGVGPSLQRS